jgi:hypothetical protein
VVIFATDDVTAAVRDAEYAGDQPGERQVVLKVDYESVMLHVPEYGLYGLRPGHGGVVVLEFRDGVPYLLVWADITQEDATHVISLEGAHERFRDASPEEGS